MREGKKTVPQIKKCTKNLRPCTVALLSIYRTNPYHNPLSEQLSLYVRGPITSLERGGFEQRKPNFLSNCGIFFLWCNNAEFLPSDAKIFVN